MKGELWNPAWIERLRQKRREGLSCGDIAKQMSEEFHVTFTRNSIIGKLTREGIPAPGKLATLQNRLQLQHRLGGQKSKESNMSDASSGPHLKLVPEPESEPCRLIDLPDNGCRWPVNNSTSWQEPHLFCGQPASRTAPPYCAKHYPMSVVHVRLREPAIQED